MNKYTSPSHLPLTDANLDGSGFLLATMVRVQNLLVNECQLFDGWMVFLLLSKYITAIPIKHEHLSRLLDVVVTAKHVYKCYRVSVVILRIINLSKQRKQR